MPATQSDPRKPEPTTRRTADNSVVPFKDAIDLWAEAGRGVLERIAATYGAYLTYAQMAEEVQHAAGVTTGMAFRNWIGKVLFRVAQHRAHDDEPMLTSLVVHSDETIGEGYGGAVAERYGSVPDDLDQHAAEERLKCYRYFGADLPPNGGRPQLPPKVADRRDTGQRRSARPLRARCPTCHLELPASGRCDMCDP